MGLLNTKQQEIEEEIIEQEQIVYSDMDEYNLEELINHITSIKFKKMQIDENFTTLVSGVQLECTKMIQMCIEFYEKIKPLVPEFIPDPKDKIFKKKYIYIKPKFPVEELIEKVGKINTNVNLSLPLDLYKIPEAKEKFKNNNISVMEFGDSFADLELKKDMIGISKKMLSKLPSYHTHRFVNCYNSLLNGYTDEDIFFGRGTFIYKESKNGPKNKLDSFREIVSIPTIVSHFHRILALRINNYMAANNYIDSNIQKGAISGVKFAVMEQILKVKEIIKHANNTKSSLCLAFLDVSNAFGSVDRPRLYEILEKYGIPQNIIEYIKKYYENFKYYAITSDWKSPLLQVKTGLVQGCPLSPILFVTVLNYVLVHLNNLFLKDHGYVINGTPVLFTAYMDDVCIITKNTESMELVYSRLKYYYECIGLTLNASKSAIMNINCNYNIPIDNIPQVSNYKYLGEYLSNDGTTIESLKIFLKELNLRLLSVHKKKRIPNEIKLGFFTKSVIPWIKRKMLIMYDISNNDRKKIIAIIKEYMNKWGNNDSVKIFTFMTDIINSSNDSVIDKLEITDTIDNNIRDNELANAIMDDLNINFSYSEINKLPDTSLLDNPQNKQINIDQELDNDINNLI